MEKAPLAKGAQFRHQLEPLLSPREELLWTGQPKQGIRFHLSDIIAIPVTLIWGVALLSGIYSVITTGSVGFNPIALLFLLVLSSVALYIMVGRFLVDAYRRTRTFYGITNRRIIIHNDAIGGKTLSYDLKSLSNLSVEQKRNGQGTITIGVPTNPFLQGRGPNFTLPGSVSPVLDEIGEAQQVYELIQDIRD